MFTTSICLICDHKLLRHARAGGEIYWFCSHCRQEMPILSPLQPIKIGITAKGLNEIRIFQRHKTCN